MTKEQILAMTPEEHVDAAIKFAETTTPEAEGIELAQKIYWKVKEYQRLAEPDTETVLCVEQIQKLLHHQLQKAREESGKEMFNRIKADITKLEYETDGDTFKKIVLSRLSSLAWFDALHHSELDQDKALQDNK